MTPPLDFLVTLESGAISQEPHTDTVSDIPQPARNTQDLEDFNATKAVEHKH